MPLSHRLMLNSQFPEGSEAVGDTLADATRSEGNESDSESAANESVEEEQAAQQRTQCATGDHHVHIQEQ